MAQKLFTLPVSYSTSSCININSISMIKHHLISHTDNAHKMQILEDPSLLSDYLSTFLTVSLLPPLSINSPLYQYSTFKIFFQQTDTIKKHLFTLCSKALELFKHNHCTSMHSTCSLLSCLSFTHHILLIFSIYTTDFLLFLKMKT